MKEKRERTHNFFHRNWVLMVLIIIGLVFLFGHSRWGGWGHRSLMSGDPAKIEEKMADIEEDLIDKLELRNDQLPAFHAYTDKLKIFARKKLSTMHEKHLVATGELEKEQPDMARLAELAKQMIRERSTNEELESLVDETLAFYQTLDAKQQDEVRDHLKRHQRWHH